MTLDYARTNNLHVTWNENIVDIHDRHELVDVIFQSIHLNRIIAGLEMFGPFRDLHRKGSDNFITNAIRAIGNFLIHEERL